MKINSYNFNKISSNMGKEFGSVRKGEEGQYSYMLQPIEENILKTSRLNNIKSGRDIIAAIHICLFVIDGYLKNIEYELAEHETNENKDFVRAILTACDPFTNNELNNIVSEKYDINTPDGLKSYFEIPVMCLLRIEKSIETWSKEYGSGGYIYFLETQIGRTVKRDDKMNYPKKLHNIISYLY